MTDVNDNLTPQSLPSRRQVLQALAPYATPSNKAGLLLFAKEYLLYWGAIAAVLFAPSLAAKVAAGAFAGFQLSLFVTLGHDAAHRTLVASRPLNKVLALLLFLPCMHNYRLWVWDHHEIHHPETNGDHFDSYTPYSKAEFDRLPLRKQLFERIIRAPNAVGFGLHYLIQRMLKVRIWPRNNVPARHRRSAWKHTGLLLAYHALLLGALALAPAVAPITAGAALLLGFAVPLFVFAAVTGGSLYLMHTHRQVPWFKGEIDRRGAGAPELCSTHLALPRVLSQLVHNVFAHSAHHAHPGVPSYRLYEAQRALDALLDRHAVVEPMSLPGLWRTMRDCKLYDYERHQWLDFNGNPTTEPIVLASAPPTTAGQPQ